MIFHWKNNRDCILSRIFLSHLLPYDPEIKKQHRLKDGLNEYLLLLSAAEEAMEAFARGELAKFDPLVGENSCQIRAVKIAIIASEKNLNSSMLLDDISSSKRSIIELIEMVNELLYQEKSLKNLLDDLNIDVILNFDALFIIKSYILSKVKILSGMNEIMKFCKNEKTDTKRIKELGNVGREFANNLVRNLRTQLSKSSARFVLDITKCPLLAEERIEAIISDFSISHKGLHCTPFYWMTKLIMHQALVSKIPIIIFAEQLAQDLEYKSIEETTLFFQPTELGYKIINRDVLEVDQPVIIFTVVSCRNFHDFSDKKTWEKELTEYDLLDLVLACNAAHRQYPDPSKEEMILEIQDESYSYHLEKSREWGCHLDNPFRFFLTHVYCDSLKNI